MIAGFFTLLFAVIGVLGAVVQAVHDRLLPGGLLVPGEALFRCENFWLLATVALSFVFGKNYPIMDYLGLKDSSR